MLMDDRMAMTWHMDIPQEYRDQIVTGDARVLAERLPEASVDLVFTDPPYPKQYDGAFCALGSFAGRVLKEGGRLLTLCGHYQIPLVLRELEQSGLVYDWIIAQAAPGKTAAMFQKRVWASWKPCLVFRKGTITSRYNFALDIFTETTVAFEQAKTFHKWGQGAPFFAYYIGRWSLPCDVVLDPFVGGGTVPAVCKMLGRHWIGFEIDADTAERARERVADTQLPLFTPEPRQEVLPL